MKKAAYNLPIFLFVCGILGYGGCFALHTLAGFDLITLIDVGNADDAFYYHQIARNLAEGKFSTFDGGITRTNGYHPLWMFLIAPLHWAFDPTAALFAVKAFEIMLIAGGIACIAAAVRLARLPWILLFGVPALFYLNMGLLMGMESAAALFMLGFLFLVLLLYARNPARWKRPLAAVLFVLPWARLEYMAISLAAASALCLIEYSLQEGPRGASWKALFRGLLELDAAALLLGAAAGIFAYFAYNGIVFGGIVPVSGAIKAAVSQTEMSSLSQNFQDVRKVWIFVDGLPAALEICAWFAFFWHSARRSRRRRDYLTLVFMVGAFSLAAGHFGKFAQTVVTIVPRMTNYMWYFVPAYLMTALLIPIRCYAAIQFVRRFIKPKRRRSANLAIVAVGAAALWTETDFSAPFRYMDWKRDSTVFNWRVSSYATTQITNRVLPEGSVLGSWDAGIIGYFSRFPVVNLDGLVNSWDYFEDCREILRGGRLYGRFDKSPEYLSSKFGITHLMNGGWLPEIYGDKPLIETAPLQDYPSVKTAVLTVGTQGPLANESEKGAWFWEKMEPHFDYHFGDAALFLSGRVVQAFGRNCGMDGEPKEMLRLSRLAEADGPPADVWHSWAEERNMPGGCTSAFLAPHSFIESGLSVTRFIVKLFLGSFEGGLDGWKLEGEAVTNHADHEHYAGQQSITGNAGPGFLTSFHPDRGDEPVGRALSPEFAADPGQQLFFLLAGGRGGGVGLRLLADGEETAVWRGKNSERLEQIVYSLDEVAGKRLQLELFDNESGNWGHIMLDRVMVAQQPRAQKE